MRGDLIFGPEISRTCITVNIIDDSVAAEPIECFIVNSEAADRRLMVQFPSTTICIVDNGMLIDYTMGLVLTCHTCNDCYMTL